MCGSSEVHAAPGTAGDRADHGPCDDWAAAVERLCGQARRLRNQGRATEAVELLSEAIRLAPQDGRCHVELAMALLGCGQWTGALVEAKRGRTLGVTDPIVAAVMGLACVELGQFDRARASLASVGPSLQSNARLLIALGRCHRAAGDWEEARRVFAAAVRLAPHSAPAAFEHGVACAARGRLDEAEEELRRACRLDPAHADAYFELGCIQLNHRQHYREALWCNQKALEIDPNHWGANVNCAASLLGLNRAAEAEPFLRRAVRVNPRQAVAWRLLGCALGQTGRLQESLDVLEHGLKLAAPDDQMLQWLRDAGEKLGDREALLARFDRLLRVHRRWALLHAMRGMTLHDLNRFDPAEKAYRRAARLGLHEPWLCLNHCRLLCKAGRPHEATRVVRRGLARWPDNLELVYHLGLTYLGQQRPVEAQRIFARLAQRDPNNAEAAYMAGDLLMQRGRKYYRRVVAYLQRVIELQPNHADALWNLAAIYHCWRRVPEARHFLVRAEAAGARDPRLVEFKRSLGLA